jgi:ABC-type ATPase involved in cell division
MAGELLLELQAVSHVYADGSRGLDGCSLAIRRGSRHLMVWFVGAGPGDPDLITVKGRRLLEQAGAILFAGSLVDQAATLFAPPAARSATRRT